MRHDDLLGTASSGLQGLRRALDDKEVAGDAAAAAARACVDAQAAVIEGLRVRKVRWRAHACTRGT